MNNEELTISLAKEGHEYAFRQLYENNREVVYRLAYRYTKSQQDAEDILQETFIKVFKGIKKFRNNSGKSFSCWLCRICVNCAINHLRRQKRRQMDQMTDLSTVMNEVQTQNPSPEKSAQINQTIGLIQQAITKLTDKQRVIFDMRFSQGMAIKEIAEIMNCSESNIKTQIFRSLNKLKQQLGSIGRE